MIEITGTDLLSLGDLGIGGGGRGLDRMDP